MKRFLSDYGMLGALFLLCAFFSWRTWDEQHPTGEAAGQLVASAVEKAVGTKGGVLIAARDNDEDRLFAAALSNRLSRAGLGVVAMVHGEPVDARRAMNAGTALRSRRSG